VATDFFQRQSEARQSTRRLVILFVLGVAGIVGGTFAIAYFAFEGAHAQQQFTQTDHDLPNPVHAGLAAGGAALALIGGGSLVKVAQLRGGGTVVAEGLGGKRVFPDAADQVERRLLNVVEEMAIASGVPTPPVFLLDNEAGINAFAAGYSPSDAVVAVTRGCAEQLSREELQGVVAHEFSHILNGDMRLNIRLIGILHGILLLGLIGRILLRTSSYSRSDSRKGAAGLILIGLAVLILGYLGTLMGNLIKAAVSRQREYLADASAVQFTRNPGGLAGALKRIGAAVAGSKIQAASASEVSHMFFAQGVWEGFTSLTATHPPLKSRIVRLDPNWDGKFAPATGRAAVLSDVGPAASGLVGHLADTDRLPLAVVREAAEQVGEPTDEHRSYAASLIAELPSRVIAAAREPYGARAVVYCLLIDRDPKVRRHQWERLEALASADVVKLTDQLLPEVDALADRVRLPLVDLTLPALRAMSPSQYQQFSHCFQELVLADERIALFEWTLHRILLRHLRPQFEKQADSRPSYYGLQKLARECSVLLSTLAHADNRRAEAPTAVARAADQLPGINVRLLEPSECGLTPLKEALDELCRVAPKQRRLLVNACAACICADREVTVAEAELLRGICDMLDCPMPPLLPGQRVSAQPPMAKS
jgi:Zn-dependent protease with chaperone function/uncharacterized tellurite resistance protein B-like protein